MTCIPERCGAERLQSGAHIRGGLEWNWVGAVVSSAKNGRSREVWGRSERDVRVSSRSRPLPQTSIDRLSGNPAVSRGGELGYPLSRRPACFHHRGKSLASRRAHASPGRFLCTRAGRLRSGLALLFGPPRFFGSRDSSACSGTHGSTPWGGRCGWRATLGRTPATRCI